MPRYYTRNLSDREVGICNIMIQDLSTMAPIIQPDWYDNFIAKDDYTNVL